MIVKQLHRMLSQYPVVSLTGPRQSGKTTLLKHVLKDYQYCNLEDHVLREYANADPKGFLSQYEGKLIIDEAQYAPKLFSYIQLNVDESKLFGQYVLSGSQNFLLAQSITQSLAGRVAVMELLPLSIAELRAEGVLPPLYDLLIKGCYPGLYDNKIDIFPWYRNYIKTYVERDVRSLMNIKDLSVFAKFLKLCALRNGQVINYHTMASDLQVSSPTVKHWISILEASYLVFQLPSYTKSIGKRVIKSSKLYFYDPGLVASLIGVTEQGQLMNMDIKGSLYESLMVSEFYKYTYNHLAPISLSYWRYRDKHEIDLIVSHFSDILAIEFKSGATIKESFFNHFDYFASHHEGNISNYVMYGGNSRQNRTVANVIPWYEELLDFH